MLVNIFNSESIKLQGIAYYIGGYNYYDLNHNKNNFNSQDYNIIIDESAKQNHWLYGHPLAVINLTTFKHNYEEYYSRLSKNVRRDIIISKKRNFYFKEFNINEFVNDFSEINFSQNKKKGSINPWYLKDPLSFKGMHSGYKHIWEDKQHYSTWYGVFRHLKNYKQGNDTTHEKLLAYCKLAVDGEMATITLFWGHADYFKYGIMFYMVSEIVKKIMSKSNIKCLLYYQMKQYSQWKSRMLFEPIYIKIIL
tara:strand:+ start:15332 stop:16084 length:753 start_codon:yes stop_codon:yes gene_type:complete